MNIEAAHLISKLGLAPLPHEGGFFGVTWASPVQDPAGRPSGSAILFLITELDFSAFHRLKTDEIWHFHAGDPAELFQIDSGTGALTRTVLGPDPLGDHQPQAVARAGFWQGARLQKETLSHGWALFGCTLSPAWDGAEFELGDRGALLGLSPANKGVIDSLTRVG